MAETQAHCPLVMLRKLREAQLGQGRASELPKLSSNALVKRLRVERVLEGHDGGWRTPVETQRARGGSPERSWAAVPAAALTPTPPPLPRAHSHARFFAYHHCRVCQHRPLVALWPDSGQRE
jgi:hypothetical protein